MIYCRDCTLRNKDRVCCVLGIKMIHDDFGCIKGKEKKPQGPFRVAETRDASRGLSIRHIKRGERESPQLRTRNEAQAWLDFMNYEWSITGMDDTDISPLYRTIGSKLWLDALMDSEIDVLVRDIYPVLFSFLWVNGHIDLPAREA